MFHANGLIGRVSANEYSWLVFVQRVHWWSAFHDGTMTITVQMQTFLTFKDTFLFLYFKLTYLLRDGSRAVKR